MRNQLDCGEAELCAAFFLGGRRGRWHCYSEEVVMM